MPLESSIAVAAPYPGKEASTGLIDVTTRFNDCDCDDHELDNATIVLITRKSLVTVTWLGGQLWRWWRCAAAMVVVPSVGIMAMLVIPGDVRAGFVTPMCRIQTR